MGREEMRFYNVPKTESSFVTHQNWPLNKLKKFKFIKIEKVGAKVFWLNV